jgi:uroporphyrinogen decarboxylase
MVPRYKRITEVLHKHGIKFIFVDCDGNHEELTPLWLESGVNGVYPLEITAGMDPVKCRKEYGKDLLMIGGMDKRVLSKDKAAIKEEVMSKVPWLVEQGGYIPSVDHSVPPDVPYENYQYYMGLMKEVIGVS